MALTYLSGMADLRTRFVDLFATGGKRLRAGARLARGARSAGCVSMVVMPCAGQQSAHASSQSEKWQAPTPWMQLNGGVFISGGWALDFGDATLK